MADDGVGAAPMDERMHAFLVEMKATAEALSQQHVRQANACALMLGEEPTISVDLASDKKDKKKDKKEAKKKEGPPRKRWRASGYQLFSVERRDSLKAGEPELKGPLVMSRIGTEWKALEPAAQAVWNDKAKTQADQKDAQDAAGKASGAQPPPPTGVAPSATKAKKPRKSKAAPQCVDSPLRLPGTDADRSPAASVQSTAPDTVESVKTATKRVSPDADTAPTTSKKSKGDFDDDVASEKKKAKKEKKEAKKAAALKETPA